MERVDTGTLDYSRLHPVILETVHDGYCPCLDLQSDICGSFVSHRRKSAKQDINHTADAPLHVILWLSSLLVLG